MKYKCDQSLHEQKKFPCTLCNYQATQQDTLTKHKKSVHHKSVHEGVTYNCNICQSTFRLKGGLSQHIKSVHMQETHQCKICEFQATQKVGLSRHIKNVHEKSENINCECNKSIQRRYLKQHMKLFHSAEQTLYSCNLCTYQSIQQSAVKQHALKVHQKYRK